MSLHVLGRVEIDFAATSQALQISENGLARILKDGRSATALVTEYLASDRFALSLQSDGLSGRFLVGPNGPRWKVKAITDTTCFSPSGHRGKGREFCRQEFEEWLNGFAGFLLFEPAKLPSAPVYCLPKATLLYWRDQGQIDYEMKIGGRQLLRLVAKPRPETALV